MIRGAEGGAEDRKTTPASGMKGRGQSCLGRAQGKFKTGPYPNESDGLGGNTGVRKQKKKRGRKGGKKKRGNPQGEQND